ncbi:MAG: dihydropteroate synthase [Thermodesulfobacteriota bacterium]
MKRPTKSLSLRWAGHFLDLDRRSCVMGVLNVTPDSFSDGGRFLEWEKAVEHGLQMAVDGADIIDVGGESTRPYAEEIPAQEELDRVLPVVHALAKELKIPISIDTVKSTVAREALRAGASMINDVSAFRFDPGMASLAAGAGVPVILMHMKGVPRDMQEDPTYGDLMGEIADFLKAALERAVAGGVREEMIVLDPGIGFGKTFDHNLVILKNLRRFGSLGRPILIGPSRKAFLGRILDRKAPERDTGTMAAVSAALLNGAHIVRVHNVKMAVETARVIDAVKRGRVEQGSAEVGMRNAEWGKKG